LNADRWLAVRQNLIGRTMTMTTDRHDDSRLIDGAHELLERTERALAAVYSREVKATDEDTWTLVGFRAALTWVLSYP